MDFRGRIALFSLHTSPLDQPGSGDSGGMNVYVRSVSQRLAEIGVAVDVFTRCAGRGVPEVEEVSPGFRVIQIPAGPCAPVPKGNLPEVVRKFANTILEHPAGGRYDLVHGHYWLSGAAAREASRLWAVPLVASFHTLGRVKNHSLVPSDRPEPRTRLKGEEAVVRAADRILASSPAEAADLHRLYDAPAARIRLVPGGVDTTAFRPLDPEAARQRLGLAGKRVVLFVGRLQSVKGVDVAIRAAAEVRRRLPGQDIVLAMVGGPSGEAGALGDLRALADAEGIANSVRFLPPRPHAELPGVYAAADAVVVPSRTESFGLVALEAQACGIPVVASAVGGLRYTIAHGETGYLVPGHDPRDHADRLIEILGNRSRASMLSEAAVRHATAFPWEATASATLSAYAELVPGLEPRLVAGASA